jgi:hypothetical protein
VRRSPISKGGTVSRELVASAGANHEGRTCGQSCNEMLEAPPRDTAGRGHTVTHRVPAMHQRMVDLQRKCIELTDVPGWIKGGRAATWHRMLRLASDGSEPCKSWTMLQKAQSSASAIEGTGKCALSHLTVCSLTALQELLSDSDATDDQARWQPGLRCWPNATSTANPPRCKAAAVGGRRRWGH